MKGHPDAEESALFREAIRGVKPLAQNRQEPALPRPAPRARFARAERRAVLEESLRGEVNDPFVAAGDELSYKREGVRDSVLRKLRRGEFRIQGEIDLHGLRREEAREALAAYLRDATKRGLRCVRVVHGKGLGSPGREPVLKAKVKSWLVQRSEVLAFTHARPADGGHGALIVLLKLAPARSAPR